MCLPSDETYININRFMYYILLWPPRSSTQTGGTETWGTGIFNIRRCNVFTMVWMDGYLKREFVTTGRLNHHKFAKRPTWLQCTEYWAVVMEAQCHSNGLYTITRPLGLSSPGCFGGLAKRCALLPKLMETVTDDTRTCRCGTERHCTVASIPTSYSGDSRFKPMPRDRLSYLRIFMIFLTPSS
jgi:hypothetical protein